ncbi:hypothetical protein Q3G72_021254 [Acer saccharum]|nr:hypothetical protein Q3G72_021254 [Acer saccharum]
MLKKKKKGMATVRQRWRWWQMCNDDGDAKPASLGEFLEVERRIGDSESFEVATKELKGSVADGFGCFLRERVTVETKQPVQCCLRVDLLRIGKVTTMLLRYKRLQDYCFRCDRIGHKMDEYAEDYFGGEAEDLVVLCPWGTKRGEPLKIGRGKTVMKDNDFDNDQRDRDSGEFGRKEESRLLIASSGCMEAEVDPIGEGALSVHGKDKNCGSLFSSSPKISKLSCYGENETSVMTNWLGRGSDGPGKKDHKTNPDMMLKGHEPPSFLDKLMQGVNGPLPIIIESKPNQQDVSDSEPISNLKSLGKWKRVSKGKSKVAPILEDGEEIKKEKGWKLAHRRKEEVEGGSEYFGI